MKNASKNLLEKQGLKEAEAITKKYAKTFYFASRFLDKKRRYASYAIYAICRLSDETVDSPGNSPENLKNLKTNLEIAYSNTYTNSALLSAFRKIVSSYEIPKTYFDQLLEGIHMDLDKKRYKDFDELYEYCYRVAGVVGLIMIKIFGYNKPEAQDYAVKLGIAMQLTNILRDIKEDILRGRIYIPQDELVRYSVAEKNLSNKIINNNFKNLMKFQIERARNLYKQSNEGIKLILNKRSRFVISAMSRIYEGILDSIEKNDYDIFSTRAHVNLTGKLGITLKIFARVKFP